MVHSHSTSLAGTFFCSNYLNTI